MNVAGLFGISILMSFISFGVITRLYIWPAIRRMAPLDALIPLLVIHTTRFAGLSFLVPGVVSESLAHGFAAQAAYGDLVAAILALIALWALKAHIPGALLFVWIFNVWGTADLLNAIYQGEIHYRIGPGSLGAAYFIPAVIVPALLITHGLIFYLLIRSHRTNFPPKSGLARKAA